MRSFTDSAGETWDVQVTLREVQIVRSRLDLCLAPMLPDDMKPIDGDKEKTKLTVDLERLSANTMESHELFMQLLWTLCERQAEARGIAPEDFAARFDLDAYADARLAVDEEITLFSLSRQQKATAKTSYERRTKAVKKAMSQMSQAIMRQIEASTQALQSTTDSAE